MTVVTCLEESWERLDARALKPMLGRFGEATGLLGMNKRIGCCDPRCWAAGAAYAEAGFTPPSPTWPFSERAIAQAAEDEHDAPRAADALRCLPPPLPRIG